MLILGPQDDASAQDDAVYDLPLNVSQKPPLEALAMFKQCAIDSSALEQPIRVTHEPTTILWTMFRLLKSGQFNIKAKPDVMFNNQPGIDANGLTRELCHIILTTIREGINGFQLFEGAADHLIPVHSEEYTASTYFEYAGKLIAHSVLHAGFGFVGLSRAIVEYLVTDDTESCPTSLSVEDILDLDIRESVKRVF